MRAIIGFGDSGLFQPLLLMRDGRLTESVYNTFSEFMVEALGRLFDLGQLISDR